MIRHKKKNNYSRNFRFLKYDTVVNEISTNDFKPFKAKPLIASAFSLVIKAPLYYGFLSRARAINKVLKTYIMLVQLKLPHMKPKRCLTVIYKRSMLTSALLIIYQ